MRTDRQKFEFAQECVRIEKSGGDVLEHIEKNYPSYTPRATWINLQKIVLRRSSDQITDGKPKKGAGNMDGQKKERENITEVCEGLADLENGEPIRIYLERRGYKNPVSALSNLKNRIKGKDPELYARIKDKGILIRKKDTELKGDKKVTAQDWKDLEGENVHAFIRPQEKGNAPEIQDKIPDGDVECVAEDLVGDQGPLEICTVMNASRKIEKIVIRNRLFNLEIYLNGRIRPIIFNPEEWKEFMLETGIVLQQLGKN